MNAGSGANLYDYYQQQNNNQNNNYGGYNDYQHQTSYGNQANNNNHYNTDTKQQLSHVDPIPAPVSSQPFQMRFDFDNFDSELMGATLPSTSQPAGAGNFDLGGKFDFS